MKLIKSIILLLVAAITFTATKAQEPLTGCPKVIFHSFQIADSGCDNSIKRVGLTPFSNKVIIKYQNKEKRFIPEDSVWGIRRKNDYPYRLFEGDYYRLYQLSPVLKYSKRVGKSAKYYFSSTLDSPIYSYNLKQLKRHTDSLTYAYIIKESDTTRHEMAFDFFTFNTRVVNNLFWGGGLGIKYYPSKKFSSGIYLAISGKNIKDTFNFSIIKPVVTNTEIGWVNQYDLVQNAGFRIGVSLINGLLISELRDKAIKERVRTTKGYRNVSKEIAINRYYLLEPGLDFSFKLISNKHDPDYFLTAMIKYRSIFGSSKYGSNEQFGGFLFGIGLSLIGFDK